jgi:hypothetical protein
VYKNRLYKFLTDNHYLDQTIQKGFWPGSDGVLEHTEQLSHMMKDAKKHARGIIISLLDLKNAFGEIHHNLIRTALEYHNVPSLLVDIFSNTYENSHMAVAVNSSWTDSMKVGRGVLQGDPSSPLIFNLCFNILMKTLSQPHLKSLGYMWSGTNERPKYRSWLQFADDEVIILSDVKSSQTLLNLFVAWCEWADMKIRIDKCCTFGMAQVKSAYSQIMPCLYVGSEKIPSMNPSDSFTYLGKVFNFEMKNSVAKDLLVSKLKDLLRVTSDLRCKVQLKLKILKLYVHSQIQFELKIYNFSVTWVEKNLDNLCFDYIRRWTEQPVSSCVKETVLIPKNKIGLGIPSIKCLTERMTLLKRNTLKMSKDGDIRSIWEASFEYNIMSDSFLIGSSDVKEATRALETRQLDQAATHFFSLPIQGAAARIVVDTIPKSNITAWSTYLKYTLPFLHNFAIKALKDVLPTAKTLSRWTKKSSPICP